MGKGVGNEPLGEIGTRVLFENDRVKIWNLIVGPGGASPWHDHPRDYITISVEGPDEITVEFGDGREAQNASTVGAWKWHENHVTHRVLNPSAVRHTNVLIELKDRD